MVDSSTRDPRAYELMSIFIPDLSDDEVGEELERVSGYLTSQGATITNINTDAPWGRRRIAYTIRFNSVDYRDGVYSVIHFESIPSVITEIERELKLDTRVMRYLLILNEPPTEEEVEEASGDEAPAEASAPVATEAAAPAEATETAPAPAEDVAVEAAPVSTDDAVASDDTPVTTEEVTEASDETAETTEEVAAAPETAEEPVPTAAVESEVTEDTTKEN